MDGSPNALNPRERKTRGTTRDEIPFPRYTEVTLGAAKRCKHYGSNVVDNDTVSHMTTYKASAVVCTASAELTPLDSVQYLRCGSPLLGRGPVHAASLSATERGSTLSPLGSSATHVMRERSQQNATERTTG